MKIDRNNIKKALFPFIESNKLEELLSKKWWHRLIVVLFSLVITAGVIASILLSVALFLDSDQDLNFLSGFFFGLSSLIIFYIFILIIQFLYFHAFLYIIYGDNSNISTNFKIIFKQAGFSIVFLVLFGAIIYFTAIVTCDKDRMFFSDQLLSFVCECNSGYEETVYGCYKAKIPENAHGCISESGWCCDSGYSEDGDLCVKSFINLKIKR